MAEDFVHLHTHSHSSAFDGLGSEREFISRAVEMGQSAIAFTEHGSVRGLYEATVAAKEAGLKLIPGCEFYMAEDATRRGLTAEEKADLHARFLDPLEYREHAKALESRLRVRDHVTVWALNDEGVRSLCRLSSWSWTKGYYYKPRIDLTRLLEHREGLAVSSGCMSGIVASPLRHREVELAVSRAEILAEAFGDRFYIEVMPHVVDEPQLAPMLLNLADRVGARVLATQDAHYPRQEDSVAHDVFLCIQTQDRMDNPERKFQFSTRDFWLRSREEMRSAYRVNYPMVSDRRVEAMLDETVAFSERCSGGLDLAPTGKYLVAPTLPPDFRTYDEWLVHLCRQGLRDRFPGMEVLPEVYRDRLLHELRTIRDLNFAPYHIAVWDIRRWSREQGIACGPGRGSAAGSLVCYLLRITDLDPIVHGLMFERYLAPGRKGLPDVDMDFEATRREEAIDYVRQQYGEDRVARISTRMTLGGKGVLQDLARVYGIPPSDVLPVSSQIISANTEEDSEGGNLGDVLEGTEAGRAFTAKYPDVVAVARRLEGTVRGVGQHAAGVVISSVPLADVVPVESTTRSEDGERVAMVAFDQHGAENTGLVKVDFLGLKAMSMMAKVVELTGVKTEEIPLEDPEVLQAFTDHRFVGIFQFDSPAAHRTCHGFTFKRFGDIAAMTALDRPGPARTGLVKQYVDRSLRPESVPSVHPIYDEVFKETYGVPVYQEQVIRLVRDLCGYTPERADEFRKKVAKKIGLNDERAPFLEGAEESGMFPEDAERLFDRLVGFAEYAFNKSHSYSYAVIAHWQMWFKVHHPVEFFTALLATETDSEKQLRIAGEARRCGIQVLPPDVCHSGDRFEMVSTPEGPAIVGSVADLKGIGPDTAREIAARRPFKDLLDFYRKTAGEKEKPVRLTAGHFEILAKATALRSLCPASRPLVVNARVVWEALKSGILPEFDLGGIREFSAEERAEVAGEVYPMFRDLKGVTVFDAVEKRLREASSRVSVYPSGIDLNKVGGGMVLGRLAKVKLFPEEGGGRSGRVLLVGPDGGEIVLRVDAEVLDKCGSALSKTGIILAGLYYVGGQQRVSSDGLWRVDSLLAGESPSPVTEFLLHPVKTHPRDPAAGLRKAQEDESFTVEGMVVRVQQRRDKSGGRMLVVSLLGSAGYVRFFVWASRVGKDLSLLTPGTVVNVQLQGLRGGDAACLGRREVRKV